MWQLEPRSTGLSLRDCTTSTTSTTSTRSLYALKSELEISSCFAASLASGPYSDTEDFHIPSPGLSSPVSSANEYARFSTITHSRRRKQHKSHTGSPLHFVQNVAPPLSSVESLNAPGPGCVSSYPQAPTRTNAPADTSIAPLNSLVPASTCRPRIPLGSLPTLLAIVS